MLDHHAIAALERSRSPGLRPGSRASVGAVPGTPKPWWQNFWVIGGAAIGAFWGFEGGDPKTYGEVSTYAIGTRLGAAVLGTGLGVLGGLGAKKLLSTEA